MKKNGDWLKAIKNKFKKTLNSGGIYGYLWKRYS